MKSEITTVGKRGTIVIPVALRKRFGVHEGDILISTERRVSPVQCNGPKGL